MMTTEYKTLTLIVKPNEANEDLSCLLCGFPRHDFNKVYGSICEYVTTFRRPTEVTTVGLHATCFLRNL